MQSFKKQFIEMKISEEINSEIFIDQMKTTGIIVVPKINTMAINIFLFGFLSKNVLENPYYISEYNYFPNSAINKYLSQKMSPNVIFVEGEPGIGKTHFLEYSILKLISKNRRVYYFNVNTLLEYIKNSFKSELSFSEFDKIDCVVIDDFQLLNRDKLSSFFHGIFSLIDYLIRTRKMLIVTSDVPPYNLHEFPERITTRLASGIFTKINPPDRETKRHYIHTYCKKNNLPELDESIINRMANYARNFRQLNALLMQYQFLYEENKNVNVDLLKMFVIPKQHDPSMLGFKISELRKLLHEYYAYQDTDSEQKKKVKKTRIEAVIDSVIFYCITTFDEQIKKTHSKSQIAKALNINPKHLNYFFKKGEKEYASYNEFFKNSLLQVVT